MRTLIAGMPRSAVARLGLVSVAALLVSACSSDADRLSFFGVDADQPAPTMVQAHPVQPVQMAQLTPTVAPQTMPAPQTYAQPTQPPLAAPTGYTPPNTSAPGYGGVTGTTSPIQAPARMTPQPLPQPVAQQIPQQVAQAPSQGVRLLPPGMVGAQPQATQPTQFPTTAQPLPAARSPQPVASQPLSAQPQPLTPQQVAAPQALALPAPATLPATTTAPSSAARPAGWSAVGGTRVQVAPGETLYSISRRYGVPVAAIEQANGLSGGTLQAGQQLVIPTYSAAPSSGNPPAQIATATSPRATASVPSPSPRPQVATQRTAQPVSQQVASRAPAAPTAGSGVHVVSSGDTAYNISRRYGMTVSQLASMNGLSDPGAIRIGQRLNVRGGQVAQQVASTAPALPTVQQTPVAQPQRVQRTPAQEVAARSYTPPAPQVEAPTQQQIASRQTPASEPAQATNSPLQFRWPIRGRVLSGFGGQVNGVRNDGINIAVPEGASIRAAEDGEVVYAGNELRGFGNLVLVQHRGGYVTAYAHNSRIMVNRGDRVSRGEIIARAGATGDVDTPQLHFEIRRGTTPVDPGPYLPQS